MTNMSGRHCLRGLYSYDLYSYGLYSYGLYDHGLHSYGLQSAAVFPGFEDKFHLLYPDLKLRMY